MGEQRAIRWSDVDFALHRIHIRQSAPKWLDEEKAPKSNRQRWVDLTPELAAALRSMREGGELVFCNDDGRKLAPGQFHEILWAAQKRSGLRRIKWHELRHSFASILASGGMPLFILRALLPSHAHQSSLADDARKATCTQTSIGAGRGGVAMSLFCVFRSHPGGDSGGTWAPIPE